jgi:hypothetical protein
MNSVFMTFMISAPGVIGPDPAALTPSHSQAERMSIGSRKALQAFAVRYGAMAAACFAVPEC